MERNTTGQEQARREGQADLGEGPRVADPAGSQPVPLETRSQHEQRGGSRPTEEAIPKNNKRTFWTVMGLLVAIAAALLIAWSFVRPAPDYEPLPGGPELNIPE